MKPTSPTGTTALAPEEAARCAGGWSAMPAARVRLDGLLVPLGPTCLYPVPGPRLPIR